MDPKLGTKDEALQQIQLIVDNSYDAIIGETLEGIITSWNGGAERMFGYSKEEVIGNSIDFLLPQEAKGEILTLLDKVKAGKIIADYDTVRIKKDGSKIDVSLSISPIKKEDGTIIGASVVEKDITQRKKWEIQLKESNEMRNKFINIISHQLGTPLTAINWNLELILNGDFGKLKETQHKFLQATHKESLKIINRVHDLLTAMDIEEGRSILKKEKTFLDNITATIMNEMTKKCELKGLTCQYVAPVREIPEIEIDNEKIQTVITKLTENAINYTKEGGKVIVRLEANDKMIHFEVSDTGIGIPQEEQHHIFDRFFRASNASVMNTDAFGLGLSIAKSFVDQHKGKIGFTSKEGKGSLFWFEIPITLIK